MNSGVLEDHGVIFDATRQPPEGRIAYFTSLCPLRSGAILCGFQNGPDKHAATSTIRLCRSVDGGQSWALLPVRFETRWEGVPGSLAAAELVEVEPGRLLLFSTWFDRSDPARPLFDPVTEGILKSQQLLAVSHDDGNTWGAWRELLNGRSPRLFSDWADSALERWHDRLSAGELQGIRRSASGPACRVAPGFA